VTAAGRPCKPIAPEAPPAAAALGGELRYRRLEGGLTLQALGARAGYSPQHVSSIELAVAGATPGCVAALDAALDAEGALLELLPAVIAERLVAADCRAAARRRYDEDVEPTNRRGLLGMGAGAALGGVGVAATPAAARDVDPELPAHLTQLLSLLGQHEAMFGPHDVLDSVRHQLSVIAEQRERARGELRVALMRVEARWAGLAAWLSEDTGQSRSRDACMERALRLAQEADYRDMVAYLHTLQSRFAAQERDARRAIRFAEVGLRVPGTSEQTRALCARQAALGYALGGDAAASERSLADAYGLLDSESPAPPWASAAVTHRYVRAGEARCWLWLQPSKAISMYEDALREWPRTRTRDGGLHQARLALACAAAGEHDRAAAEGRKALTIARTTKSSVAARELKQLGAMMRAA
jgi:transcriptional regulator with XRE-family HTH domain